MFWSPHKFRHMTQNWILISNYNLTFSKFFLLIYIYIYIYEFTFFLNLEFLKYVMVSHIYVYDLESN